MKAINRIDERIILSDDTFVEVVVWEVGESLEGSEHLYRHRLDLVIKGECAITFGQHVLLSLADDR